MKKKVMIVFSIIVIITMVFFVVFNFVIYKKKYSNFVIKYSAEYNLDKALVYAVIKTESDFDAGAVSPSGALGLMQMIPSTASWVADELGEEYSRDRLFEPDTNIKYGCFYLRYLFDKFDDIEIVVCAYNAGENAVLLWLDDNGKLVKDKISYKETKNYLSKVMGYYNIYSNSNISI